MTGGPDPNAEGRNNREIDKNIKIDILEFKGNLNDESFKNPTLPQVNGARLVYRGRTHKYRTLKIHFYPIRLITFTILSNLFPFLSVSFLL